MAKAYLERAGDVAELVISAPPLNLLDGQMIGGLEAALAGSGRWPGAGPCAVLLRAEGRVFGGVVDVHEFQGPERGPGRGPARHGSLG